jgi:hypothetical protein
MPVRHLKITFGGRINSNNSGSAVHGSTVGRTRKSCIFKDVEA